MCAFSGDSGKVIQDTPVTITASGDMILPGYLIAANVNGTVGDVNGPTSSTDNALARFDGATGKIVQNSLATLSDAGVLAATNLSGTNTGDLTLAAFGSVPNANGASLVGQVLTIQPASATQPGATTTAAQSLAGVKTFTSGLALANPAFSAGSNVASFYDYRDDPTGPGLTIAGPWAFTSGGPVTYERFQHTVTVFIDGRPGTFPSAAIGVAALVSNASYPTTYIPADFLPPADRESITVMVNAGAATWCHVAITSTGVITISNGPAGTVFPAGGNVCGIPLGGTFFTYRV